MFCQWRADQLFAEPENNRDMLRQPSSIFFYHLIAKFVFILKSLSDSSGRRSFHTRAWVLLRMSRILFATKQFRRHCS